MTPQEVFDKVVSHLREQKVKSMGVPYEKPIISTTYDNTVCMYRGENGLKCAIGCLISDDEYDKKFEGAAIDGLIRRMSNKPSALYSDLLPMLQEHQALLGYLQIAHDNYKTTEWEKLFKDCAKSFKLKYTKP